MKKKAIFTNGGRHLAALCLLGAAALSSPAMASGLSPDKAEAVQVLQNEGNTVKSVLSYIEGHSKYVFVYGENVKDRLGESVSIRLQGKSAESILDELCRKAGLKYTVSGRQVTITVNPSARPAQRQKGAKGNGKKVTGVIADTNGEPLIGATVKVKGTQIAAVTDFDGNYSIEAPEGATLEVSYIGFNTQEVKVGSRNSYNIEMAEDNNSLEELVVIGYGTVKKKDLTGAISAVKGDDLSNRRTTMLSSALQGALSGVMVRRSSSAPGSGAGSIHVRGVTTMGDSSPLVIVDGVEGDLDYVNANDVENVTVLKDAAAASIYGSKAAAGVILVTTKRGSDTGKFQIKYNAEFGWEIPTKQPEMVGVTRYLEMFNELRYNDNPSGGFFQEYSADRTKNWMKYHETDPNHYPVTDWTDLILKSSAPRMTHTISLSGGNKYIRSQTSLSYDDVDGLYDGRKFQRYMLRSNNDFTINKWLSASLDLFVRHAKSQNKIYDPFSTMRQMPAIYAAVWDDGRLADGKSGANPYGLLKEGGSTVSHSTQVGGKGSLTIKPFEGLSIQAIVSPYINYQKSKQFKMACGYTLADDPNTFGGYFDGGSGQYATNKLTEGRNDDWHVTSQVIANYMRDFGKHSLTVMAGFENYYSKSESLGAARDQYVLTNYPYLNIGPEEYMENSGTGSEYTSTSWFGRVLYSYADRYLFQANVRHDGSSRFAKKYRWGTFPSFSAGWVVTEEPFMKNFMNSQKYLSYFKLRGSWGKLGNERIGSNYFPYIALMSFGNTIFYMADGSVVSANTARPAVLAVEDITWETTTSTDIGFDANFFDNRLRLTFDYYWKKTTDMLLAIQIPYTMGYNDPNTNAGKMSTHGYDIDLTWQDHIGDFNYSISVNFSDFLSKIDYINNSDIISGGKIKRAGTYFNEWYGYICDGIYQTQEEVNNSATLNSSVTVGDLKYRDISGPDGVPDGVISPEYDRVPLGNSLPRYQYGGQINASWRGIDLSMAFQGVGNQKSYLERAMVEPLRNNYGNIPAILEGKYWSPFNTDEQNAKAFYPRLTMVSKDNNYATSDHWIFNGGYFRMKNITLGYTLPQQWTRYIGIDRTRFYVSASDLFCISDFPDGWDPEMGVSSYPITTSVVFGIQVTF